MLYKIKPYSFIACSYKNKKIIKYTINQNNEIKYISKLDNIQVNKGNNSIVYIPFSQNILLICCKDNSQDHGIIIVDNNKFEIVSKIKNINPFYYINITEKQNIITIDKKGLIQKWKYVKKDQKLYECDKVSHPLNMYIDNKKLKLKSFININNSYIFQYNNALVHISN